MHQVKKKVSFFAATVLFAAALAVCLAEVALSFFCAPWPRRNLRPLRSFDRIAVENRIRPTDGRISEESLGWNDWGQRDYKRSVRKPDSIYRVLMIGDSFLEGGFCDFPLPTIVDNRLIREGRSDVEAVNLGVSNSDPIEYYFRLKDPGIELMPNEVFIFFYSGNDFLKPTQRYSKGKELLWSKFIAMKPVPSLLGSTAPRLTNLVLKWNSDLAARRSSSAPQNEYELLNSYIEYPFEEGIAKLAEHMHLYYFPDLAEHSIRRVLERGGDRFWLAFRHKGKDDEHLQGWILNNLIRWEQQTSFVHSEEEAALRVDPQVIDATFSWLEAARRYCLENRIRFRLFVIPVDTGDPDVVEFWNPWPAYYSWNFQCDAWHTKLVERLQTSNIEFTDLRLVLNGIRGTYRKTDRHWTEKGHEVVAQVVRSEILHSLRDRQVTIASEGRTSAVGETE